MGQQRKTGADQTTTLSYVQNINLAAYCMFRMFLTVSRKTRGQINDEKADLGLILHLFPLHNNIYILYLHHV